MAQSTTLKPSVSSDICNVVWAKSSPAKGGQTWSQSQVHRHQLHSREPRPLPTEPTTFTKLKCCIQAGEASSSRLLTVAAPHQNCPLCSEASEWMLLSSAFSGSLTTPAQQPLTLQPPWSSSGSPASESAKSCTAHSLSSICLSRIRLMAYESFAKPREA